MDNLLPLFPLNVVVFPEEPLNLHIFEPRYIELINDVLASENVIGMPAYINHTLEYGTTLRVAEVSNIYDDGRMDIKTIGCDVFKVIKFYNPTYGKLYAAGKVEFLEDIDNPDLTLKEKLRSMLQQLFNKLELNKEVRIRDDFKSYDVAHLAGLSFNAKYEMLKVNNERGRQEYLLAHLNKILPVMDDIEETRARISMNGHFRFFDPLNF